MGMIREGGRAGINGESTKSQRNEKGGKTTQQQKITVIVIEIYEIWDKRLKKDVLVTLCGRYQWISPALHWTWLVASHTLQWLPSHDSITPPGSIFFFHKSQLHNPHSITPIIYLIPHWYSSSKRRILLAYYPTFWLSLQLHCSFQPLFLSSHS